MFYSQKLVILDHVTVSKKTWLNRNRVNQAGSEVWLRVPTRRGQKTPINEISIAQEFRQGTTVLRTLENCYRGAPFFDIISQKLFPLISAQVENLAQYNLSILEEIFGLLDLQPKLAYSSEIIRENPELKNLAGNQLLLELAIKEEITDYISGWGCLDFIQPEKWEASERRFYFQNFAAREYPQRALNRGFVPQLSIIDSLMELGPEQTRMRVAEMEPSRFDVYVFELAKSRLF